MKTYFFISDVHLGAHAADTETREKKLFDFLDYAAAEGQGLFIVGDLFDFWFEYRSVIPRDHFDLLCKLKRMVQNKIEIHYLAGNHDFWLSTFLTEIIGVQTHSDSLNITLNGRRFHITHGDGIAKNDGAYRILKRILRNPVNIKLFRWLHPDFGFWLAGRSSHASRTYRDVPDHDADYIEYAKARFEEGCNAVIMGHTHRPMLFEDKTKQYLNTGDWLDHFSYGQLKGTHLTLKHWTET